MIDQQQIENLVRATLWKLLGNKASLRGKGLIARIATLTELGELQVQGTLAGLAQAKWLSGVYANGIPTGMVTLLAERPAVPESPSFRLWNIALREVNLNEGEVAALLPLHESINDFSHDDRIRLINGLVKLRDDQEVMEGSPTFLVSAKYLLGSSKILDSLSSKALRAFGINTKLFTGAHPVVLIAGPPNPKNVVLVENPHAFWRAIGTSAIEETVFLVTFGYGLSRHGEDYGNQLASLLESTKALMGAVCAGSPPSALELLKHGNISFWGDLDVEGLRIYLRLKKVIPLLSLSSLYKPMLEAARDPGRSHAYVHAAAKNKQVGVKSTETGFQEDCSELLIACCDRAVDQETVSCEEITIYAGGAYVFS